MRNWKTKGETEMAIYLSPSMLSIDFTKVGEQLAIVEQAGVPYIHLDVMDGVFVPNISFGIPAISRIFFACMMFLMPMV